MKVRTLRKAELRIWKAFILHFHYKSSTVYLTIDYSVHLYKHMSWFHDTADPFSLHEKYDEISNTFVYGHFV